MSENTKSDEAIKAIPAEDVEVIPPDGIDTKTKDIPLETLIALRNKGLTLEEIAKLINCCKQSISQGL